MSNTVDQIASRMIAEACARWRAERTFDDGLTVVFIQAGGQSILTLSRPISGPDDRESLRWREAFRVPLTCALRQRDTSVECRWAVIDDGTVYIPPPTTEKRVAA